MVVQLELTSWVMESSLDYPKLRYVESFPVKVRGEQYVGLRDPLNLADKVVFLPPPSVFIVSMFDGAHSVRDIQAAYMQRFGEILFVEKIQEVVEQLDTCLFLESERFIRHESSLKQDFHQAAIRPALHSNVSYPGDPGELGVFLEGFFQEAARTGSEKVVLPGSPRALIAPHIDLREGGVGYAWAYEQIRGRDHDLFLILGTAHAPTQRLFAATRKDFHTPLGIVRSCTSVLEGMEKKCGHFLFDDEFVHKHEHSIEFQLLFLQHLLGCNKRFEVVPVLCGSFHDMLCEQKTPEAKEEFQVFVEVLLEELGRSGRKVCLVASADLAHIGLRFGDPHPPDIQELLRLRNEDNEKLETVVQRDRHGFWQLIQRENDRRRICGFPCIYTLLSMLEAEQGQLLYYGQMDDRNTGSAVSYASLVFC